jgi:fructokinase
LGTLQQAFSVPIGFATDVATAALGEYEWGAGQGLHNFLYMTVGTGIGAASMVGGELLTGMGHQELGHMLIPQDKNQDPYVGYCSYHQNCLEGLACGMAIKERWQIQSALDLPLQHPAWDLEAEYLAAGLANCVLMLTPQKIILGGGVMRQTHLLPKIREKLLAKLNGYIGETLLNDIDNYIVPPGLADRSGITGAIALARRVYEQTKKGIIV